MRGMDAPTAFLAALAVTAAGGAAAARMIRLSAKRAAGDFQRDGEAYRRIHARRTQTFADFATAADQVTDAVMLWPATPPAARPAVLDDVRAHLQELHARHAAVLLDSGPAVQAAAAAVVADCERLVDGLDLDADPAPELLPLERARTGLTLPFLRACREYQEAESARYFAVAVRRAPRLS
ncbi:hypothetical protein B9W64_37775 [Streptomyces sp. CS159]|nr:hypothetical protein B9W64_37775 [Streptomyces sp. CS159]